MLTSPDDATGELDYLGGAAKAAEEVGGDWVRDVATTRQRAEIDLNVAAVQGRPKLRENFSRAKEELGASRRARSRRGSTTKAGYAAPG